MLLLFSYTFVRVYSDFSHDFVTVAENVSHMLQRLQGGLSLQAASSVPHLFVHTDKGSILGWKTLEKNKLKIGFWVQVSSFKHQSWPQRCHATQRSQLPKRHSGIFRCWLHSVDCWWCLIRRRTQSCICWPCHCLTAPLFSTRPKAYFLSVKKIGGGRSSVPLYRLNKHAHAYCTWAEHTYKPPRKADRWGEEQWEKQRRKNWTTFSCSFFFVWYQ